MNQPHCHRLNIGGCIGNQLYIDDETWASDAPLPDPLPDVWPIEEVQISDGPSAYLYGDVEKVEPDVIEFTIEGEGVVATFRPKPPDPDRFCG